MPSALGRMQQPEPSAFPSPGSLLFQQEPLVPVSPYPGNPYSPPFVQTPMPLTAPQTPVGASPPGEMVPPHPCLGHPSMAPMSSSSVYPSLHQPNPPFDDGTIPPQTVYHPNIRVAPTIPTKVEVTAIPPIQEVIMHSNPSTRPHQPSALSSSPLSPTDAQRLPFSSPNKSQIFLAHKCLGDGE